MDYSQLITITPPASSPVSLTEAKEHARIDFPDDDFLVDTLLRAATEHVQAVLGRQLAPATYELHLAGFPAGNIALPVSPVSTVTSITYRDRDGTDQTFTDWQAYLRKDAPFIAPTTAWPATGTGPDAVVVTFDAGFDQAPERARVAIMSLVSHWYDTRQPNEGNAREVPHHITRLLNTTRTWVQP